MSRDDDDSDDRPLLLMSPRAIERLRRHRAPSEPSSNPSEEEQRLREVEYRLTDLSGRDGTGGEVGHLRKTVEGHSATIRRLRAVLAGSVLTVAGVVYWAGHKDGAVERESEYLRIEVSRLRDEVRDLREMSALRLPSWMTAPKGDEK